VRVVWHKFLIVSSMALTLYKKKRSFAKTPEPTGGKSSDGALRFVIQKHDASHLHYDFRLEMQGVLKSWAVPQGPSTDPSIKRLAMMVEDHPYDYRSFEGIIPQGQYGGGTVIVWDEGTYEPIEEVEGKKAQEKLLLKQLKSGSLKFKLHGEKLKGEFALVHTHGRGENAWLLIKHRDAFAKTTDVTKKDKSVVSGKTIRQIEKKPDNVWQSNRGETGGEKASEKRASDKKASDKRASDKKASDRKTSVRKTAAKKNVVVKKVAAKKKVELLAGKKAAFPKDLSPMLATLVDKPFDDAGWQYEIKWDGYRTVAYCKNGKIELRSRNNKSFNEKFYPVLDALKKVELDAVLDGEIIVAGKSGISDFGNLQNWRSEADGELKYYVFDILWLDGRSLLEVPLTERRDILRSVLPQNDTLYLSENFEVSGTKFFATAAKMGLEGIMAKKADSIYTPGFRTKEWLKIKVNQRQEVVIGGFTKNDDTSKLFSALLVGVYKGNELNYIGKIGTGFSDQLQKEMMAQFKPLITKSIPFSAEPDVNKPSRFQPNPPHATATWLKPKLVCEVSFTEITSDGVMRHPSFEGMRIDKPAKDVVMEKATSTKKAVKKTSVLHRKKILTAQDAAERKTFLNPTDETQVRKINGKEISFTNLSKVYWPKGKVTKRDMLNYYYQAAPYMLPYMKDRPMSLNRHPNGINGESFYQKDVTGKVPDWINTFPYHTDEGGDRNFMVCKTEADILYMASLGCIEMNPWSSRIKKPDHPDWCIIDLDPSEKNKFEKVVEAANMTRQVLDSAGVDSYCKTSGSTGLHIYIPLGAKYTYEQSKEFARLIVTIVVHQLPTFTSIERIVKNRRGKMYLDFLQNRPQATLATAYSLRPKPDATVSMPLDWSEVKKGLKMQDFTIHNSISRLKEVGDLFKPVLGTGINMKKAIENLQSITAEE
jgi:bifunctional non-homologous end joining protein LigD